MFHHSLTDEIAMALFKCIDSVMWTVFSCTLFLCAFKLLNAHVSGMIVAFSVIRFDIALQRFLFCVFGGLVISKMLFGSECFVTQCARNI